MEYTFTKRSDHLPDTPITGRQKRQFQFIKPETHVCNWSLFSSTPGNAMLSSNPKEVIHTPNDLLQSMSGGNTQSSEDYLASQSGNSGALGGFSVPDGDPFG